jgi:hypothetical protein
MKDPAVRERRGCRAPVDSASLLAGTVVAAALWLGCGGGSPSDVVLPQEVDVTLVPQQDLVPRTVNLDLAAASGRDLSVRLLGTELEGVTGVAFELRYDPVLLEFRGVGPGTFFGQGAVLGAEVVEAAPGRLVGVAAGADQTVGRSGSGSLLTLQFRLLQLRDGETPLGFGAPESRAYDAAGTAGQHAFIGARLVTRIRAPQ